MEAKRDENRITTLLAALDDDGVTPTIVCSNPNNHRLCVSDDVTGSDFGIINAVRDENRIPVVMAISSTDGVTPVELYADSLLNLLIKSS